MIEIQNAIITGTMLGIEDHGIFTAFIFLDGDSWGCGFGGYAMDGWSEAEKRRIGTAFGIEFIREVLAVVGVEKWEDLKGKHVRAESTGLGGSITRLGHITKNRWFNPKELAEKMR